MIEDVDLNNPYLKMDILRYLIGAHGKDFVTEDLIRDVNKIYDGLFKA